MYYFKLLSNFNSYFRVIQNKMPCLSAQVWRAFALSEMPFYYTNLPSNEPSETISHLPSSAPPLRCGVFASTRRRTRIGHCVSVRRVSLIYSFSFHFTNHQSHNLRKQSVLSLPRPLTVLHAVTTNWYSTAMLVWRQWRGASASTRMRTRTGLCVNVWHCFLSECEE